MTSTMAGFSWAPLVARIASVLEKHGDTSTPASIRLAFVCGSIATGLLSSQPVSNDHRTFARAMGDLSLDRELDRKCASALQAILRGDGIAFRMVDELDGGL